MPAYDYSSETRPWTAAAGNISRAMMQLPALRAQLKNQAYENQVRQAQTAHYNAETEKTKTETSGLSQDQDGDVQISKALRTLGQNPNDPNAIADLLEGTGKSWRHHPDQTAKGIGDILAVMQTRSGSTNFGQIGALQGQGASVANNINTQNTRKQIADETPVNVPQNSTLVDRLTGDPLARGNVRAGQGDTIFAPGADNVTMGAEPIARGLPPRVTTPSGDAAAIRSIYSQIASNRRLLNNPDKKDFYDKNPDERTILQRETALLERQAKQLQSVNRPTATATQPAPQPAAQAPSGKVVIQNGQRFQLNPDGTTIHLGPAQ